MITPHALPAARRLLPLLAALAAIGCGSAAADPALLPAGGYPPPRNEVVFLGDSLTAGAGLSPDEAYPAVIGAYWARRAVSLTAVNAGVGGDRTTDVLARLDRAVSDRTCLVFLEIGPNDGFARRDLPHVERDLSAIVERLLARRIPVVIAGMWLPMEVGAGRGYRDAFDAMYANVGARYGAAVMPSFLRNVVSQASLWQRDGIHPTAEGDRILARDVLAFLNPSWRLEP